MPKNRFFGGGGGGGRKERFEYTVLGLALGGKKAWVLVFGVQGFDFRVRGTVG